MRRYILRLILLRWGTIVHIARRNAALIDAVEADRLANPLAEKTAKTSSCYINARPRPSRSEKWEVSHATGLDTREMRLRSGAIRYNLRVTQRAGLAK